MLINPDASVSDIRKNKTSRNYSDRLFRKLFNDEKRAIELCNALVGEHYTEDTPVKLCSINENSLLARYNDVAFVVEDHYIVLCEHQSTNNVNMPLRFLPYISDTIYTQLTNADKLYGDAQISRHQNSICCTMEKTRVIKESIVCLMLSTGEMEIWN